MTTEAKDIVRMIPHHMRLFAISLMLIPTLCLGDGKPLVPLELHTVVTTGSKFYEGKKLRAVLVYGETGQPIITIESIRVEMAYPSVSEVIWQQKIDILGDSADLCPFAETYCAYVENLEWIGADLPYELAAPEKKLLCRVEGIASRAPVAVCQIME